MMLRPRWKVFRAIFRPEDIHVYRYVPKCVVKTVSSVFRSATGICQLLELQSSVEETTTSSKESLLSSMLGSGERPIVFSYLVASSPRIPPELPYLFQAKTTFKVYLPVAGSMTLAASSLLIFVLVRFRIASS